MIYHTKFNIGQEIQTYKWTYHIDHISITEQGIRYGGECWEEDLIYPFMVDLKKPMSRFGLDEEELESIQESGNVGSKGYL